MSGVFLLLLILGGLSSTIKTLPAEGNHTIKSHNSKDHGNVNNTDTISNLVNDSQAINYNFNQSKTDSSPLTISTTTAKQPDTDNAPNATEKPKHFVVPSLLEYSALSWLKNEYVMSIVIPIAAGIGSGLVLIILINMWRCARSRCQRSCHRKNRNLPKHIKQMKLADRMKLLEESSDEEF